MIAVAAASVGTVAASVAAGPEAVAAGPGVVAAGPGSDVAGPGPAAVVLFVAETDEWGEVEIASVEPAAS